MTERPDLMPIIDLRVIIISLSDFCNALQVRENSILTRSNNYNQLTIHCSIHHLNRGTRAEARQRNFLKIHF